MRKGRFMPTTRSLSFLVTAAFLAGTMLIYSVGYAQPQPCVPPQDSSYVGQFHLLAAAGRINLNNPEHAGFTHCFPPPPPGERPQIHEFGSTIAADVTIRGTTQPVVLFGQTVVKIKHIGTSGDRNDYRTELLALDLQGTTPDGHLVRLRESPTRRSNGKLNIRPSKVRPGENLYDGYFLVHAEISVDDSAFMPDEGGPRRMQLSHSGP